jgi:ATP-dependent Zn protease
LPQTSISTQIAGLTPGFTGADLANLANDAAIVATRRNGEAVALDDFTVAADRIEASEATEREIDIAVRGIVVKAFERATEVLRERRADLDEGARLLLAQETVTADQFPAISSPCPKLKPPA